MGAGGMGEVYRALDTRLKRDVALKVLPASVAGEAERLLRFAREAEMLAALNHPNIAAIYGVEDSGGLRALVMELVDGETLAEQIARGPIPLTEALAIARQIAVALEAAHEQGIVHRDLKPANIKLRDDGTVKVLDFGLAKLADPVGASAGASSNADGTGSIDKLATLSMVAELFPHSWSDANTLIVSTTGTGTSGDVLAVSIADGKVTPLLATPVVETQPAMSPNGRWLAYMAVRERRPEVYVERYPQLTDRRTLSDQGVVLPLWSADGGEGFYFEPGSQQMMSVSLSGSLFGAPKPLFKVPLIQQRAWRTFDLMPDGRFIMILRNVDGEEVTPVPMVIQNFSDELKRRVPVP